MDSNSHETIINIGTVAFVAVFLVPLHRWVKARITNRLMAAFATAFVMLVCIGLVRATYETLRQENPAIVDEALGRWKVFAFLKDHEPAIYAEVTAQIKARWPVKSGELYAVGHQFWQKHGAGILAKYGKVASDEATANFYRFQEQVMSKLYARADSACYLFMHGRPNSVQIAAETVTDYNRLTDSVVGALLRSGAEQPQAAPVQARVEQHLQIVGERLRKRIGEQGVQLIDNPSLASLSDQKRACAGYTAFVNEILALDRASASAVLRSFW